MVGLIQLTKPARMVYLTGHGPCACRVSKRFKVSLRGAWLKWSHTPKVLKVQRSKGFRVSRDKGFQGIKGTIFSLSVLDYAQRYYTCPDFMWVQLYLWVYTLHSE